MKMIKNVGPSDRYVRFLIGLGFFLNIISLQTTGLGTVILVVLGLLMFFTAFSGYCFLYDVVKKNTLGQPKAQPEKAEQASH